MEQSGGQIAAKVAKPPDGGEDRLSALPDDVLLLILECLDTTAEAVRTGVLARRWRRLWPLLTKLCFHLRPDGDRICELLDVPDAPELRHISVTTKAAAADSVSVWLAAAARRLAGGGLFYRNMAPIGGPFYHNMHGIVQLPCFENATAIELDLCYLGLALPSHGILTRLTHLSLSIFQFCGPCDLGDVVSSTRCPCLQKLSIDHLCRLGNNLSIHSESLVQMELRRCSLSYLTIVTPILQKLIADYNFLRVQSEPVANITAPQIVSLVWMDWYDPRNFHLGDLGQLRELQTRHFSVYGEQSERVNNHSCLRLLQRFQVLYSLRLRLLYYEDICHRQYLLGDITTLPHITFLHLDLLSRGHTFGPSLFHLLGMCMGLRRLSLVLYAHSDSEDEFTCPWNCICDQAKNICGQLKNWRTDELVLDHLEDVHIIGPQGAEHEVAFVQLLLSWATVLKSLGITLHSEMAEGEIGEFRKALVGFSRPETCIQFDTSENK